MTITSKRDNIRLSKGKIDKKEGMINMKELKHTILTSKGYNTQMYEYEGYKIWRTESSHPFRLEKEGKVYWFREFDNPKKFSKISLNMICKLIDNGQLKDWYECR